MVDNFVFNHSYLEMFRIITCCFCVSLCCTEGLNEHKYVKTVIGSLKGGHYSDQTRVRAAELIISIIASDVCDVITAHYSTSVTPAARAGSFSGCNLVQVSAVLKPRLERRVGTEAQRSAETV